MKLARQTLTQATQSLIVEKIDDDFIDELIERCVLNCEGAAKELEDLIYEYGYHIKYEKEMYN